MFPNLLYPRFELSQLYLETEDIKSARMELQNILKINPKINNENTQMIKGAAREVLQSLDIGH